MNPLTIQATLIEDKGMQSFKKGGDEISFRNILVRYNDRVIKFKTSTDLDTENLIDEEVLLTLEIKTDNSLNALVKVVNIERA